MPTYRAIVAYDGTRYAGWQVQRELPTIQGMLEAALQRIGGESIRVTASGRTDAGVHALGQVIAFRLETRLTPGRLCRAINANTPEDIFVRDVSLASDSFHPIADAIAKRYRYLIDEGPEVNVFQRAYAWQIRHPLDIERMRAAARHLIGTYDFSSFEAAGSPRASSVRSVDQLTIHRRPAEIASRLEIEISANGFLYNMVRNIVGALVVIGRGEYSESWMAELREARDRRRGPATAPPHGLYLVDVTYPAAANLAGAPDSEAPDSETG